MSVCREGISISGFSSTTIERARIAKYFSLNTTAVLRSPRLLSRQPVSSPDLRHSPRLRASPPPHLRLRLHIPSPTNVSVPSTTMHTIHTIAQQRSERLCPVILSLHNTSTKTQSKINTQRNSATLPPPHTPKSRQQPAQVRLKLSSKKRERDRNRGREGGSFSRRFTTGNQIRFFFETIK